MDCHDRFRLLPEAIFPPPWSVEETNACFIVRDANGPGAGLRLFRGGAGAARSGSPMSWPSASRRTSASCPQGGCCRSHGPTPRVVRYENVLKYRPNLLRQVYFSDLRFRLTQVRRSPILSARIIAQPGRVNADIAYYPLRAPFRSAPPRQPAAPGSSST